MEATLNASWIALRLHAIRADEMVTRTFDRVEDTTEKVQNTVTVPVQAPIGILQGIGVGLETLFQKSEAAAGTAGPATKCLFRSPGG